MIQTISHLPEFAYLQMPVTHFNIPRLRNLASLIAQEETFSMKYRMLDGQIVDQKVLCISPNTHVKMFEPAGP